MRVFTRSDTQMSRVKKLNNNIKHTLLNLTAIAVCLGLSGTASAQVVFTFSEIGGDVVMTSSGSIDTADLVAGSLDTWGSFGIQNVAGPTVDVMGDTQVGSTDTGFEFSVGTDFSAWTTQPGAWDSDYFSWTSSTVTTPFSTYSQDGGPTIPGLNVRAADLSGSVFIPLGGWVATSETFASLGLNPGTYTVTDGNTGASITYQIGGAAPPPAAPTAVPAVPLLGLGFLAAALGWIGIRKARA